jgi:hypothetical protein
MRSILLLAVGFLFTACGGNKTAPVAAGDGAQENSDLSVEIPADAKGFVNKLLKVTVTRFNPTGSSEFSYNAMTFSGDGTWTAQGELSLGGETIDCVEDGSWTIDAMDGDNAVMEWVVTKTNCPSRDAGVEQRVNMAINGEDVKVSFR